MKKRIALLALAGSVLLALAGCQAAGTEETSSPAIESTVPGASAPAAVQSDGPGDIPDDIPPEPPYVVCRVKVLPGSSAHLLVTDWGGADHVGLCSVSVKDTQILGEDGGTAALEDLRPGMILDITWDGMVMESFPSQIAADEVRVVEQGDDLVGMYQQVLAELWTETGQKTGVERLAFDFSGLADLSAGEQTALAYLAACKLEMGFDYDAGTWDELAERGGITVDEEGYWTDGMLLSLSLYEQEEGHVGIVASSRRSKDGAILVLTCTADRQGDGIWSYQSFSPSGT